MKRNILATALLLCLFPPLTLMLSTTAHAQIVTTNCGLICPASATATPAQGTAPLSVVFNASPPRPIPTGLYWNFDHWDFGDGQTSTILQASHTYTTLGQYTAAATFLETGCSPYCVVGGGTETLGSVQVTVVVTVTPPPSLSLTPSTAAMLVGGTRTLALSAQNGNPVTGANWTIDNTAVLSLSTDDPPIITALNPGTASVKAALGSLTAQTAITVYVPDPNTGGLPLGTVSWTVNTLDGFVPYRIRLVNSTDFSKPDLFSVELTQGNSFILRGLTSDGAQMWQSPPIMDVFDVIPGPLGDAIILHNSHSSTPDAISQLVDGQPTWTYAPIDSFGFSPNPAIRPDGMLFTVEGDHVGNGEASRVVGLDESTGSVLSQYQLPTSTFTAMGSPTVNEPGSAGPMLVAPDHSIYLEFFNYDATQSGQAPNTVFNATYSLNLVTIDPGGNASMQLLHSGTYAINPDQQPSGDWVYPGEVIPDGEGGVLAGWDLVTTSGAVTTASAQLSHATASGSIDQFVLPFNGSGWCGGVTGCPLGGPANAMVVGEHNTAFAADGDTLIAFDIDSGVPRWTRIMPSGVSVTLIAATIGGGVEVKETDNATGDESVVSFDITGISTPSTLPPSHGVVYYAGHKWVSIDAGRWVGMSGNMVDESNTRWPHSAVFRDASTVVVNNFSQSGPNQAAIQAELQTLQTVIPQYATCAQWLSGVVPDAPTYITLLLFGIQNDGVPAFGHGTFDPYRVDAFTGSGTNTPVGELLTVNDNGGFFHAQNPQGQDIHEGPQLYQGGKQTARELILIHEMAHGIEVQGFQADGGPGQEPIIRENNRQVDAHCRQLIER